MSRFSRRLRRVGGAAALILATMAASGLAISPAHPVVAAPHAVRNIDPDGLIKNADPSVIRVGSTYVSVEVQHYRDAPDTLYVRQADSIQNLPGAAAVPIWSASGGMAHVWAPEIIFDSGRYYIYFAASRDNAASHQMYITGSNWATGGYVAPYQMNIPGWAIDGVPFLFNNQRWFVWSGAERKEVEQNLYIARMNSLDAIDQKTISLISQPREGWERVTGGADGKPWVNEGPQPIKDPNGQLHIVYSANGSWSDQYCLGDLRLRSGGDPTNVWDWYKSNGCLFGSNPKTMMDGWHPTKKVNGPGHHSFVLLNGDINTSPPAGPAFPLMYHAVDKGIPYTWEDRHWYPGSFVWWGNTTYSRRDVPGAPSSTGFGLKFFE